MPASLRRGDPPADRRPAVAASLTEDGARLADVGVPTVTTRYEGMIHGFVSMGDLLDDGRAALAEAADALRAALA